MKKFSGEILKLEREKRNLSIEEISSSTKISKALLRKIENSDFEYLSSFHRKYFIKTYAKFLGIEKEIEFTKVSEKDVDLIIEKEKFEQKSTGVLIDNYWFSKIMIPILIATAIAIIFYSFDTNNKDYLEKLTFIDNQLSDDLLEETDKRFLIEGSSVENVLEEELKTNQVSTEEQFLEKVQTGSLVLYFKDEVWIEIENAQEILLSRVFQKNDRISLEVLKEDNLFITSGNLGLITVKTNNSEEKTLGLNGEIGRKKIF